MISLLSIISLGFFLGMRHATDADHVIAISTIVSRQGSMSRASLIGFLWGVGHTLTILVVGSGIIMFSIVIPPHIGLSMEMAVGLMLVLLGILNLTGILHWMNDTFSPRHTIDNAHPHTHVFDDQKQSGESTSVGWLDRHFSRLALYQILRPLIVGIVHGLAGSAAVALLVLTTIRDPFWAIAYLLVFGIGTIAGMMLITAAIAAPFAYSQRRHLRFNRFLGMASGLVSLGFGLFIVYHVGIANGLFTGNPVWTPR